MDQPPLRPADFFDLGGYEHRELFAGVGNVWEVYARLDAYLEEFFSQRQGKPLILGAVNPGAILQGDRIAIGEGAKIEPTAYIEGPTIIGPGSIVGTGAYIRGGTVTGKQCVIGHCTEAIRTIMLDRARAPHFSFIGHSIMGNDTNIGAGVVLANFRLDGAPVPTPLGSSGLVKFGAVLGDGVKIGCNAVLEPGTFLGRGSWIMALASVRRGFYEPAAKRTEVRKVS